MNTLHPMVVHFPMALSVSQPLVLLALILLISRRVYGDATWGFGFALQAILVLTAFVALKSGGVDEELVEKAVQESFIEAHEEAAELFLGLSVVGLAVLALPLWDKLRKSWVRWLGFALSLLVLVAGVRAGKLGGELVYVHGAASVHVERAAQSEGTEDSDGNLLDLLFGSSDSDSD